MHYSKEKPSCSTFRVITTYFLGVRIFRKFTVFVKDRNTSIVEVFGMCATWSCSSLQLTRLVNWSFRYHHIKFDLSHHIIMSSPTFDCNLEKILIRVQNHFHLLRTVSIPCYKMNIKSTKCRHASHCCRTAPVQLGLD